MGTDDESNSFNFQNYIQLEQQIIAANYIRCNEYTIPKTKETQPGCRGSQTNTNGLDSIKEETKP